MDGSSTLELLPYQIQMVVYFPVTFKVNNNIHFSYLVKHEVCKTLDKAGEEDGQEDDHRRRQLTGFTEVLALIR